MGVIDIVCGSTCVCDGGRELGIEGVGGWGEGGREVKCERKDVRKVV